MGHRLASARLPGRSRFLAAFLDGVASASENHRDSSDDQPAPLLLALGQLSPRNGRASARSVSSIVQSVEGSRRGEPLPSLWRLSGRGGRRVRQRGSGGTHYSGRTHRKPVGSSRAAASAGSLLTLCKKHSIVPNEYTSYSVTARFDARLPPDREGYAETGADRDRWNDSGARPAVGLGLPHRATFAVAVVPGRPQATPFLRCRLCHWTHNLHQSRSPDQAAWQQDE